MALNKIDISMLEDAGADGQVLTSDGTNWTSADAAAGLPAAGADGQVLTLASGVPSWAAAGAGGGSPEIYGFKVDATGSLIITTTNSGVDNISSSEYANFDDVVIAVSGITWSILGTDLIATV